MIVVFPRNKLSLIKTVGILEQSFNMRQDNFLRIFIDMTAFFINLIQDFKQIIFLIFRQMQSFIHRIREKSVARNGCRQRMFQQKIFVKNQYKTFAFTIHRVQIQILHLIGSRKTQNTLVIIVMW